MLLFFPKIVMMENRMVDPATVKQLDSLAILLGRDEPSVTNQALFLFNPNVVSEDSLMLLGFHKSVARRLINYRSKGGKFYTKQDVKKIYGVTDQLMDNIYSFINLPEFVSKTPERQLTQKIDINRAGVDQLKEVKMIGDIYASRIVKYRNSLGGFLSLNQLDEVYGLPNDALRNLKSIAFINSGFKPKKLKVNHAGLEELQNHPYISDRLAEDMVRFREVNAAIESEKVLVHFKSIEKSKFEKLILYLDFQ